MKILGIETTTRINSLALLENEKILDETDFCPEDASKEIFIHLDNFLKRNKISLKEIDLFVTSLGPGSWTGIRLGITLVKGFIVTSKKKAIGVYAPEHPKASLLAKAGYRQFQRKEKSDLKPFYGKAPYLTTEQQIKRLPRKEENTKENKTFTTENTETQRTPRNNIYY